MVTKKYIKRMTNLFNELRGPKSYGKDRQVITPFRKAIINSNANINHRGEGEIYRIFYNEVLFNNHDIYHTQKLLDKAIKFIDANIKVVDDKTHGN